MSKKSLEDNIEIQFNAIDICIENGLLLPSLILIYSGIDSLASLNRPKEKEKVTRSDFEKWCNDYLLFEDNLKCNATDLYAARCSILHTSTAISDLSLKKKASEIIYFIGDIVDKQSTYKKIIDEKYSRKTTVVNIETLVKAFKNSYLLFSGELDKDPVKKELVYERAKNYFVDSPLI